MARKARIKSSTGIYHVLVRAISNLSLFTDEEDAQYYTNILNDLQQQGRCEVYAYALFPTHVHLLIRAELNETAVGQRNEQSSTKQAEPYETADGLRNRQSLTKQSEPYETAAGLRNEQSSTKQAEPYENENCSEAFRSKAIRSETIRSEAFRSESVSSEPIGTIMKRIASAYSYFFNVKYDHYGPIYLDRFKSNPVETKDYFLKVLNHIGSQQTDSKYTCRHIPSGLSDSINHKPFARLEETLARARTINPRMLDYTERPKRITDSRLMAFLQQNHSFTNIGEFLQRPEEAQEEAIRDCKKEGGSIRQIVRLTGSPYQAVFQVK